MSKENEKDEKKDSDQSLSITTQDLHSLRWLLDGMESDLQNIKHLLFSQDYKLQVQKLNPSPVKNGKIIEGVFNGEAMIGSDGKKYLVPPNYASKSKLVSGDVLKLSIAADGTFIYKQIAPVERKKMIGELKINNNHYLVQSGGKNYKVLSASVTYFKVQEGDKLAIIIPQKGESEWAAIENVVEKKE